MRTLITYESLDDLPERFWSKVHKTASGCWEWTGASVKRYGQWSIARKPIYVHRLTLALSTGVDLTPEVHVDHLCRNPPCCNPEHLEAVTLKENVLRGSGHTAINARKTQCINGHAFDAANTYRSPKGSRECRTCRAARRAEGKKS